jgi:hypothetical protein
MISVNVFGHLYPDGSAVSFNEYAGLCPKMEEKYGNNKRRQMTSDSQDEANSLTYRALVIIADEPTTLGQIIQKKITEAE